MKPVTKILVAEAVILLVLIGAVLYNLACHRDTPEITQVPDPEVLEPMEVPVTFLPDPNPLTTYYASFVVPPLGTCWNHTTEERTALDRIEIWTGHPTRDGPIMAMVGVFDVHQTFGSNPQVRVIYFRDKFLRMRFVDVEGVEGCWLTVGDMYMDKEERRRNVR